MSKNDWSKLWIYFKLERLHNKVCPHCVWVEQAYDYSDDSEYGKQFIPLMPKPDKVFQVGTGSVSIFNSTGKFTPSHLCVLGSQGDSSYIKHQQDVRTLLIGSAFWVSHLNTLGINNVLLVLSSHFDQKRGEKEHLHAFICPNNSKSVDAFNMNFPCLKPNRPKIPILDRPCGFGNNHIIEPKYARRLFTEPKPIEYLGDLFGLKITENTSWYLFMYFIKTFDGTKNLSGILAVDGGYE